MALRFLFQPNLTHYDIAGLSCAVAPMDYGSWSFWRNHLAGGRMFLISTRKRNPDKTFGHQRMLKGDYAVYEISKASEGKDAQQKTLEDIPTNKDLLLLIHGFNNDFDEVTAAYLGFDRRVRAVGFNGNVIGFTWPSYGE